MKFVFVKNDKNKIYIQLFNSFLYNWLLFSLRVTHLTHLLNILALYLLSVELAQASQVYISDSVSKLLILHLYSAVYFEKFE